MLFVTRLCRQLPGQVKLERWFLTNKSNVSSNFLNLKFNSEKISTISKKNNIPNHKNNMNSESELIGRTRLAIFDFDCTIIQFNSDDVVQELLPCGPMTKHEGPYIEANGWTKFMDKIFRLLHEYEVKREEIKEKMCAIQPVPGMVHFIKALHDKYDFEIIIISDSNSIFINDWLTAHGLNKYISKVFTNPAHFDKSGVLKIEPYHHQTDCTMSPKNLCKGKVVDKYLADRLRVNTFKFIQKIYIGDGQNDICPAMRLESPNDVICVREGYIMSKLLNKNPEKYPLTGKLVHWKDGYQLLNDIEKYLYTK